jgi:D-sedoheptulose 7-phosphate isomerase
MSFFPDQLFESAGAYCDAYFEHIKAAAASVDRDQLRRAAEVIERTVARGGTIYACGNGGSAAIANHLACDCLKGIRTDSSIKPRVSSLSATIELITAIANDISYEEIFRFQLSSLGKPGDALIAISSSGQSPNIVNALSWARENGIDTIAMTGFGGGQAGSVADINLHVRAENYGVVEDVHQSLMHLLSQYVRHRNLVDPSLLGRRKF